MNLNRDFLKTLGGILIIGAIVVATFLYGNQQRQEQIRKDEQAKQQAEQQVKATAKAKKPSATGGGNLPSTTPQTGGEELVFAIPALAVGIYGYQSARRRRGYTL